MKINKLTGFLPTLALAVTVFAACNMGDREEKAKSPEMNKDTVATTSDANKDNMATAPKTKKVKTSVKYSSDKTAGVKVTKDKEGIYISVDQMPQYPGGETALADYLQTNINYDQNAIDSKTEGTVRVSFVVDEKGNVESPKIVGETLGSGLDNEVIRAINNMPDWKPGMVNGKNVKTRLEIPVTFQVSE